MSFLRVWAEGDPPPNNAFRCILSLHFEKNAVISLFCSIHSFCLIALFYFIFFYFLINSSFTLYELASVRFPLNEHVCAYNFNDCI